MILKRGIALGDASSFSLFIKIDPHHKILAESKQLL
jgi:hypothetical protein